MFLPQAADTAATFTPLAPFSKLIGKGMQEMVNAIQRRSSTSYTLMSWVGDNQSLGESTLPGDLVL